MTKGGKVQCEICNKEAQLYIAEIEDSKVNLDFSHLLEISIYTAAKVLAAIIA